MDTCDLPRFRWSRVPRVAGRRRLLIGTATALVAVTGPATAISALAQSPPLQAIDWANSILPGTVCESSRPIQLHDHSATLAHTGFGKVNSQPNPYVVDVHAASDVVYGSLAGVGNAAGIDVTCSNNGGTADGQLRFADVIFGGSASNIRTLGIITPQVSGATDNHVPTLGTPKFSGGKIIVREAFYGPNDPTCCSTGRATTTWAYAHGKLKALRTIITKRAAS